MRSEGILLFTVPLQVQTITDKVIFRVDGRMLTLDIFWQHSSPHSQSPQPPQFFCHLLLFCLFLFDSLCMDGWMDGMGGWTDGLVNVCVKAVLWIAYGNHLNRRWQLARFQLLRNLKNPSSLQKIIRTVNENVFINSDKLNAKTRNNYFLWFFGLAILTKIL